MQSAAITGLLMQCFTMWLGVTLEIGSLIVYRYSNAAKAKRTEVLGSQFALLQNLNAIVLNLDPVEAP